MVNLEVRYRFLTEQFTMTSVAQVFIVLLKTTHPPAHGKAPFFFFFPFMQDLAFHHQALISMVGVSFTCFHSKCFGLVCSHSSPEDDQSFFLFLTCKFLMTSWLTFFFLFYSVLRS